MYKWAENMENLSYSRMQTLKDHLHNCMKTYNPGSTLCMGSIGLLTDDD